MKQLGHVGCNAGTGRGEGMADGDGRALDVHLGTVDLAEGGASAEVARAILRVVPGLERCEDLGCEGFVLFNYQRALAEDYLPLMALGATSTRVPLATQARG